MNTITYAAAKRNLAAAMDFVCGGRRHVLIRRKRGKSVVMLSLEEYTTLEETAYLLSNRTNAARLLQSVQAFESGRNSIR